MDITLTQLRYFTETAARLSMTGAAENLHTTQSAVSTAIAKLERRIGQSLFIRHHAKGLQLTPTGELFLMKARGILEQLEEAVETAQREQRTIRGRVRFACYRTLTPFLLPGILARLRNDYPALDVDVIETDAKGCIEALLQGRADLALMYDMGGIPESVTTLAVSSIRPYVALPLTHPLAGRAAVSLREMNGFPFILLDLPNTPELMNSIWKTANLQPEVTFRSADFETVRTFVANGHGYAILHQRPRHTLTYDGAEVATVEIIDDVPLLPVVLAALSTTRQTARAQAIIAAVQQQIATIPGMS
ncbi:LysR substrate-binding domain-containing protein [Paenarthrobacter sp. PH39-S1]|uniref:LysR substrate-binding domain-containing protein n=1 Tax=Paenarthrobacter sp. PH39-S1 TaxID=3046204 RepID=UPI0024BB8CE5|nr:LysR substrate-binding domain-containing protein [Paenarthrobacter sp. PH39-S1]MDJ0357321.1 LysR substrate-binding domain-containing protein [Paenarthrobacter sp. PH39-S1]